LQGSIVRAAIADPQGGNVKLRPVLIYTPTDEIEPTGLIDVVAITTQIGSFPADVSVQIPWQRGGHPRTTLNQPNEAVCIWAARIPTTSVLPPVGRVPLLEMTQILSILLRLQQPPTTPATP
jgi:mRNA-degrading endonuclease toxin of MazEF toxin-antitoxin module